MRSGKYLSADAWLQLNLSGTDTACGASLAGSPSCSFRIRILPMLLAISAVIVAAMWYQEEHLHLMSIVDYIGYPVLLVVTTLGALLLKFRSDSLRLVMVVTFSAYLGHVLSSYYLEMAHRLNGIGSSYEMTALALWLPFGYVGSFVFFSPRIALHTSIAIYAAITLPQLALLGVETDPLSRQIAIAVIISQPLYIAALWGVGLLKTQASGVHSLAQSMNEAASADDLTGLANRRAMNQVLEKLAQAQSECVRSLALLMLDVDHFKRINDTYGHAIGDEVLIKFAQETTAQLRSSDLLGRWGGEEFMILSLNQNGAEAMQMAERLRSELERIAFPHVGTVTASIGVTCFTPGDDIHAFIKRADKALYQAKERGRNRIEGVFDTDIAARSQQAAEQA